LDNHKGSFRNDESTLAKNQTSKIDIILKEDKILRDSNVLDYEKIKKIRLSGSLDQTRLESYLSDEQFEKLFEMKREEFYKQSNWQMERKKKKVQLF